MISVSSFTPFRRARSLVAFILTCFCVLCASQNAIAQDSLVVELDEVRVQALRGASMDVNAPFSKMALRRSTEDLAVNPGQSLQSVLRGIAGITLNDRGHYALGERIMIRGMGWRSAFGVRGIGVIVDGIPLTLPDGQGMLDSVDPAFIRRAEVVRGPASTFWGNGSGGVLVLSTDAFSDSLSAGVQVLGGGYGMKRSSAQVSVPFGRNRLSAYVSNLSQDGFRDYSSGEITRAALHASLDVSQNTRVQVVAGMAIQDVLSPGGLTEDQWREDAGQADVRNILTGASKQSSQFQLGATVYSQTALGLISATAYGITRQLDNPLSYAVIDLNRSVAGGRIQLENNGNAFSWGVGMDAGFQFDDRANFNNDNGKAGSNVLLDQDEFVRSASGFSYVSTRLTDRLTAMGALRLDHIRFELDNHLPGLESQNGERVFSAWSPTLGVSFDIGQGQLYGNYSTAFETPTTTELVNKPSGLPGLNDEVGAQHTKGVEVGARGTMGFLRYDVAVFNMMVDNQLQSFQDSDGRTYYTNEGATAHKGAEVSLMASLNDVLSVQLAYTASSFTFDDTDLKGNRIPGLPVHHISGGLNAVLKGFRGVLFADWVSNTFANSANTAQNDGYMVVDLDVAYTDWYVNHVRIQPFARLSNALNASYVGSMVINAFGGRYYEPSPGRTMQIGVSLTF